MYDHNIADSVYMQYSTSQIEPSANVCTPLGQEEEKFHFLAANYISFINFVRIGNEVTDYVVLLGLTLCLQKPTIDSLQALFFLHWRLCMTGYRLKWKKKQKNSPFI